MSQLFLPHSVYYLLKIKELHIMLPPVAIVNAMVERVATSENWISIGPPFIIKQQTFVGLGVQRT